MKQEFQNQQVTINDKNVFGIPAGTVAEVLSEEENGAIWVSINGKKTYLAPWEFEEVEKNVYLAREKAPNRGWSDMDILNSFMEGVLFAKDHSKFSGSRQYLQSLKDKK